MTQNQKIIGGKEADVKNRTQAETKIGRKIK